MVMKVVRGLRSDLDEKAIEGSEQLEVHPGDDSRT
jgi:hypothetical protein